MGSFGESQNGEAYAGLQLASTQEPVSVESIVVDLFSEMRVPVLRHLLWMNLQSDQAEDVLQETFLRLYQQLQRSSFPRTNLRGWIWRVAHNLGVNLRLTINRRENGGEVELESVMTRLIDPHPTPEQHVLRRHNEQTVASGFHRLNERERQCVHLRAQGLGYRQIASTLGIGRSTVADTLGRVTKFLRGCSHLST